MKALFVLTELPYPPRLNGYVLRYYSLLKHLSRKIDIDLVILRSENQYEASSREALLQLVRAIHFIPSAAGHQPLWRRFLGLSSRISPVGPPYGAVQHDAEEVSKRLMQVAQRGYDVIVWGAMTSSHVMSKVAEYMINTPIVLDVIDSMHLYASRELPHPGYLDRLRLAKLGRWEARLLNKASLAMYISPIDLDWMQPATAKKLVLSPNGVTIDDYRPERIAMDGRSLGYLGNMSYRPNVAAAHTLYEIFQAIKPLYPDLKLMFIGRDPAPELLKRMQGDPDVLFTGTVENIWPFVNSVDLFVLPMTMGAGQQNKVLEIMYAGKPVVCTSIANGGVGARHGDSLMIADDIQEMTVVARTLLESSTDRNQLGARAKTFVEVNYSWEAISNKYLDALRSVAQSKG